MLLKEKLKYDIKVSGINAKININYDEKNMNLVYACYFSKDGVNIEKRNYQKSNEFIFKCDGNGIYRFVVFVKETDTQNLNGGGGQEQNKIWHQTETFEVKNYNIGVIAHEEVIDIIDSNENFFIFRSDSNFKFKDEVKYVFLDVPYIAEKFIIQNKIDVAENIIDIIRKFSQEYEEVILLDGYFKNQDEINDIVSYVVVNCDFGNVDVINHCQILEKVDEKIVYESYNRFKKVVLNDINDFIEKSLKRPIENTWVEIALNGNVLISEIINREIDKLKNVKYFFYVLKDGAVYYKSEAWLDDNKLSLELNENGIYCVQGYIKSNEISFNFKSHTVEYFTEDYKKEFNEFLNNNEKYNVNEGPLKFGRIGKPFEDFVFIQSKEDLKNDLFNVEYLDDSMKFYNTGKYGDYNSYLISSIEPIEKNNKKWIFSGMVYGKEKVYFGQEYLDETMPNTLKKTGVYAIASIDGEGIYLSNDFFNINRLFYYKDDNNIICSNRYHLILIMLKNINIKVNFDNDKILLNLSSAHLSVLLQNTLCKMDVKGVFKCTNSLDILLNKNGIDFIENEYGKILKSKPRINEQEYRELLNEGKKEVLQNVNMVLNDKRFKNVIVDLTGGLDSRVVYGAVLNNKNVIDKVFVHSHDVPGSDDLKVAVAINNIYGLKWDTSKSERKILDINYCDREERSLLMGLNYTYGQIIYDSRDLNDYGNKTIIVSGACGEIVLRPHEPRKFYDTILVRLKDEKSFIDYTLRRYSNEIIVDYNKALESYVELFTEEFKNYYDCSLCEKLDRIYLEHKHGIHFDQIFQSRFGNIAIMPLQSKTLFKLHHNCYDKYHNIKLQLDITNAIDPYLSSIRYEDEENNIDRKKLKDKLYFEKEYERNINILPENDDMSEYKNALNEKSKNIIVTKDSEYSEQSIDIIETILCNIKYLCKNNNELKERIGVALYHYVIIHRDDVKYKRSLRNLYNKLNSIKDQMKVF